MTRIIQHIPAQGLPATGGLYEDYLSGGGEVEQRLGRYDAGAVAAAARAKDVRATQPALRARLAAYNRGIGVSEAVASKLEDPLTRFVVTGQQPGALGGPLMTLYKMATARALADYVEQTCGVPAVPLYWMGADDVDFAEVREFVALTADLTPVSASIAPSAHEAAMAVGKIPAQALEALWKSVAPVLAGDPETARVAPVIESALNSGGDHGDVSARILAGLTAGEVAVLDAREPLLRQSAGDLMLAFFDDEPAVKEIVAAAGEALEQRGLHAQLWPGPDSGVFLTREDRRIKIPESQRASARETLAASPGEAAPGVILRNLVQDHVFSPVAVVLGPAEIAYRAQIAPLYERFGVSLPVSFARLSATFVPPALAGVEGFDAAALVLDPAAWMRCVFSARSGPELQSARGELLERFREARDAFAGVVSDRASERTSGRMTKRLDDIARRLEQGTDIAEEVGRALALERWPFLEHTPDVFARQQRPQERYLSAVSPYLLSGAGAWDAVVEAARQHGLGAMDGNTMHVVYSV